MRLFVFLIIIIGLSSVCFGLDGLKEGYRLNSGETKVIETLDGCRIAVNNGDKDIFLPTKERTEWDAFLNSYKDFELRYCNIKEECNGKDDDYDGLIDEGLPENKCFDWRNKFVVGDPKGRNYLTSVIVQDGQKCFITGVTGSIEAKYNIENDYFTYGYYEFRNVVRLSRRDMGQDFCKSRCPENDGYCANEPSCRYDSYYDYFVIGVDTVFEKVKDEGFLTAYCDSNGCNDKYYIDSYSMITMKDRENIKRNLRQNGPIAVSIDLGKSNMLSLVGENNDIWVCGGSSNWHVVLLVGYNDYEGYWIVKNSWGKDAQYFGNRLAPHENGFFKIKYGSCQLESGMKGFPVGVRK